MLSGYVHSGLGTLPVQELETWAFEKKEFKEAVSGKEFTQEAWRAYEDIIQMAKEKGVPIHYSEDMQSIEHFERAIRQRIARNLAEEYAKACFRNENWEQVAARTISKSEWIKDVVDYEKKIVWQTINVKADDVRRNQCFLGVRDEDDWEPDDCYTED